MVNHNNLNAAMVDVTKVEVEEIGEEFITSLSNNNNQEPYNKLIRGNNKRIKISHKVM